MDKFNHRWVTYIVTAKITPLVDTMTYFLNVYKEYDIWYAKVKQEVYILQYVNDCDVYE